MNVEFELRSNSKMDTLPYEIKRYEILPLLDSVSKRVLQNVLLNKPVGEISADDQRTVVDYGLEYTKYFYNQGLIDIDTIVAYAASVGNLELLQWAHAVGCCWDATTCARAAMGGHLELLQWCRANGCDWDAGTCSAAAETGQLDVLKWARANGCPWNASTRISANRGCNIELIKWCRDNGCPESNLTYFGYPLS